MRKILVTGLIICMLLSGCASKEEAKIELLPPIMGTVDMSVVAKTDICDMMIYDAEVIPDIQELSFEVDGYLNELFVTYGQEVHKGDVIATIIGENHRAVEELTAEIEGLEAQSAARMEVLEAELEILKYSGGDTELKKLNIKHEKELVELELKQKKEKLDEIKQGDIGVVELISPYDSSVIGLSKTTSNGYINAGTPIVALIGDGEPRVTCPYIKEQSIEEAYSYYAIIHGKEYELEYIPYDKEKLNSLAAQSANIVSSFNIKADDAVNVGDYAAIIVVNNFRGNVLTVPLNSIHADFEGKFVYEIVDGERVRRDVTLGLSDASNVEIIDGIEEGAYVYVKN